MKFLLLARNADAYLEKCLLCGGSQHCLIVHITQGHACRIICGSVPFYSRQKCLAVLKSESMQTHLAVYFSLPLLFTQEITQHTDACTEHDAKACYQPGAAASTQNMLQDMYLSLCAHTPLALQSPTSHNPTWRAWLMLTGLAAQLAWYG